jgi:hypothetical protein
MPSLSWMVVSVADPLTFLLRGADRSHNSWTVINYIGVSRPRADCTKVENQRSRLLPFATRALLLVSLAVQIVNRRVLVHRRRAMM